MLNGFISGFVSTLANVPFQAIKTSMMIHERTQLKNNIKMIQIIKSIYHQEGLFGFFRGFIPHFIRIPFGKAIYFLTLEQTKKLLSNTLHFNTLSTNMIASACGIGIQCVLTNPIALTSTRLEAIENKKYNNMFDAFKVIYQEEGMIGFTKGLKPLLIKEVPSHVLFYTLYQFTDKWLNDNTKLSFKISNCLSVMFSSVIATILDNPFDLIRTRSQYQFISKIENHVYPSVYKALIDIYRKEGIRGLQNGVAPRLMMKIVSTTVLWTVYQRLNRTQ